MPNKSVVDLKYFYCKRCKTCCHRMNQFKDHTIKREQPSKKCRNNYAAPIEWSLICQDAENQIAYYKKYKKFMHTTTPTEADVAKLLDKGLLLQTILRYHINKPFYKSIVEKWLEKKEKAGFEILHVIREKEGWNKETLIYLVKDNIIYAPYKKNKQLISCGCVQETYFDLNSFTIEDTRSKEFMREYRWSPSSGHVLYDNAYVKNFYKINPNFIVNIDKEYGAQVDCGLETQMLTYEIEADDTVFPPFTDSMKNYGYNDKYHSVTYKSNLREFVENDLPSNVKISNCTYNASDMRRVIKLTHTEEGMKVTNEPIMRLTTKSNDEDYIACGAGMSY